MPRLVVEKGKQKGESIRVDKTSAVVIGRGNTAHLQLDDPMTSRRHFSVEFKKGNFHITDLDSANGTYVNAERAHTQVLDIGDKIQAGEILMSFLADESTLKHDTVTGQKIAGYLIEERIGRGAMGTVYKAVQLSLDRTVALKILARELVSDKNFIDMFVREAQNAGQLNHPNVVQVYDVGQYKNIYFISMEYMSDGSVYELLNREGAQPFEQALEIAADSARGLCYAEKRGIVHRDVKPDNLMIGADGTTKIGDLGIARRLQAGSAVLEEGIFGSPHYMAPEQAQGLKIDCRTDIYSLGATMYHVLSGKTPFVGKSPQEIILKQINEEPPAILEVNPVVPPQLGRVVDKCMAKDPEARYQSFNDLLGELEHLSRRASLLRPKVTLKERARDIKKKYLLPVIVILIAAVTAAFGFFAYRNYQHASWGHQVKLQKAQDSLAQLQELFDEISQLSPKDYMRRVGEVLEAVETLREEHGMFPEVTGAADEIAVNARNLEKSLAARVHEKKAADALAAAAEFEKSNPDKLARAAEKYRKVVSGFPDTEAAKTAKEHARRLDRMIEESRTLEIGARAQASAILNTSRSFRARKRYGKALEELARFPERYRDTEAGKEIEAEKRIIGGKALESFARVKTETEMLIAQKRYEDAKVMVVEVINTYEIVEITDEAAKIIDRVDKLIEQRRLKQEQAVLEQDKKKYENSVAKARGMILEHRLEGAASEYRSLELLLKSERYRDSARRKLEEIDLIKSAKNTLINQINRRELTRPIRVKIGNLNATAVRATEDKLITQFEKIKGEAPRPWKSFAAGEMVSFLDACRLDAEGYLAAGVFAKELGRDAAAKKHFDKALELDSALKDKVARFSEDLK